MKKIGILTFHNTTNYGAILQAFALEMAIKKMGVDVEIINYHCDNIETREYCKFPKFNQNLGTYAKHVYKYLLTRRKKYKMLGFVKKNMIISKNSYDKSNIYKANDFYDKFIVGSDMVFNLNITGVDMNYYLDFANSFKRYSYAASLGVDEIENKYLNQCIDNLNKFQYISVREESTRDYFIKKLEKDVHLDVDPTLLHDSEFWTLYEEKPKYIALKYILLYFLDNDNIILNTAKRIAEEKKIGIIIIGKGKKNDKNVKYINDVSVGEYLYYIHHAYLVITGSYHGMIFSMNYNTNFMYFNRANSSRMESIAKLTNSESRRLTNDYSPKVECNFDNINYFIKKIRKESLNNLKNIIIN